MKLPLLAALCCATFQLHSLPVLKTPPVPELDASNMFNAIYTFPEQLQQAITIAKRIALKHDYTNTHSILFVGMADAGTACNITQTLIAQTCKKPVLLVQSYTLPAWADEHTLVICISYSGDTQGTLSCFDQAHERHIPIVGICSGGMLLDKLLNHDYDHVIIPAGLEQRAALGYMIAPLVYIMHQLHCADDQIINDLATVANHLKSYRDLLSIKDGANPTYLYAVNTKRYLPVIFGDSGSTVCIAHRWATQFAQNSKMISHVSSLTELAHCQLAGWKNNPHLLKNCIIIWLTDVTMDTRNKQCMDRCKELLQNLPAVQIQFQGSGANWCQRLFYLLYFGDWISYWCALEHATDPTPVELIATLKSTT